MRDLHDVTGAIQAQPGMKQQTFVAAPATDQNGLSPWDTQQNRVFTPDGVSPTLTGADGGGGRNPAGLLFSAGVVAKGNGECFLTPEKHTSLSAGGGQTGQGYPCVICLNDQGGQRMDVNEDITGTFRASMDGHPPLVLANQQGNATMGIGICPTLTAAAGTSGNNQPVLFENHGIDSRYTGPHEVAPTMSARYGTGGNNVPLVSGQTAESYCIAGNIIDRETHNGGNGFGYQPDISYTLNTADRHAVFSQQRSDEYPRDLF